MNKPPQGTPEKPAPLKRRIMKAGSWSLLQVFGVHGLRLCSNLIMTRLLVPEAFGLIAMVSVIITGLNLFTDVGINRSVAREPDGDQDHFLRVAWVFKVARGIIIAVGVLLMAFCFSAFAPSLAAEGSVYADPRLPALVALSALVPILMGLESITPALAMRHLTLKYVTLIEIGAQFIQIIAMITFALISPTVWALMAGMLTGAAVKSIASHIFIPGPTMAFAWDKEIALRLWHYGKWLLGSSVFAFVASNADRIILAGLMEATLFGIFVIAQIWVAAATMVIRRLIDRVGFPAISELIRTRPKEVPRLYRKFQTGIDAMCIAAFLVMFLGGQYLIDLLYSDTYAAAGKYLMILSLSCLSLRFYGHNTFIMNLGNSRSVMMMSAMRAFSICALLPLAYNYFGMEGALLVIALNPLVATAYALSILKPVLGVKQILFDALCVVLTILVAVFIVVGT